MPNLFRKSESRKAWTRLKSAHAEKALRENLERTIANSKFYDFMKF